MTINLQNEVQNYLEYSDNQITKCTVFACKKQAWRRRLCKFHYHQRQLCLTSHCTKNFCWKPIFGDSLFCKKHFREEYATKDGEAKRDDKNFTFVSAWEYVGEPSEAKLHKEQLEFENIEVKERSYK